MYQSTNRSTTDADISSGNPPQSHPMKRIQLGQGSTSQAVQRLIDRIFFCFGVTWTIRSSCGGIILLAVWWKKYHGGHQPRAPLTGSGLSETNNQPQAAGLAGKIGVPYYWCFRNPAFTSWGWSFIPLFTGFYTFLQDFFHQQYHLFPKTSPSCPIITHIVRSTSRSLSRGTSNFPPEWPNWVITKPFDSYGIKKTYRATVH